METVTYLLGAGASAGPANSKQGYTDVSTIPIVSELADRMSKQIELLESKFRSRETETLKDSRITIKQILDPYSSALQSFVGKLQNHASIDTYARKLFLRDFEEDKRELFALKRVFSTFLSIEQVLRGVDIRYDTLFATILKKTDEGLESPVNFKFISWNYDYQFELAHYNYFIADEKGFDAYINLNQINSIHDANKFFYLKLNGSAININRRNFLQSDSLLLYNSQNIFKDDDVILSMLVMDMEGFNNTSLTNSKLIFSWEEQANTIKSIKAMKSGLASCKHLVVVGYSFPIFNHIIDHELLATMPNLKTVYIQVPKDRFDDIEHRFWRSASRIFTKEMVKIVNISNLDSFYIPNEIEI